MSIDLVIITNMSMIIHYLSDFTQSKVLTTSAELESSVGPGTGWASSLLVSLALSNSSSLPQRRPTGPAQGAERASRAAFETAGSLGRGAGAGAGEGEGSRCTILERGVQPRPRGCVGGWDESSPSTGVRNLRRLRGRGGSGLSVSRSRK